MSTYSGLSERAKKWIILLAAIIAIINFGASWKLAFNMEKSFHFSKDDAEVVNIMAKETGNSNLVISSQSHLKVLANKHSIVLLAVGAGFSLIAIGFALFLIGADGAFKIHAERGSDNKLLISGTAPGLLCFILATVIISVCINHKYELKIETKALKKAPAAQTELCQNTGKSCIDDELDGT